MYSGNPISDAAAYYHDIKDEVEPFHKCECQECNSYFSESEMVYDSDNKEWIAKECLDEHLKNIGDFMLIEDFEKWKLKLTKQL
jgi:hypothetical protein